MKQQGNNSKNGHLLDAYAGPGLANNFTQTGLLNPHGSSVRWYLDQEYSGGHLGGSVG